MKNQFVSLKDAVLLIENQKSYSSMVRLCNKLKGDKSTKKHTKELKGKFYISENTLQPLGCSDIFTRSEFVSIQF